MSLYTEFLNSKQEILKIKQAVSSQIATISFKFNRIVRSHSEIALIDLWIYKTTGLNSELFFIYNKHFDIENEILEVTFEYRGYGSLCSSCCNVTIDEKEFNCIQLDKKYRLNLNDLMNFLELLK